LFTQINTGYAVVGILEFILAVAELLVLSFGILSNGKDWEEDCIEDCKILIKILL
jgi:hypothetical protein